VFEIATKKAVRDANGLTAPSGRSPRRAETIGWLKYARIVLKRRIGGRSARRTV
jgi:hypothetical protein